MVPPLDAMLKLEIDHYYLSLQLKKAKKAKDEKKIREIVKEMQIILDILDGD
jgi:hypothetical protein